MVSLPQTTTLRDGDENGTIIATTETVYDEVGYGILTGGTLTGTAAATWADPNNSYRGNVTTIKNWTDIAANQFVQTHAQYDNFGNLRKSWDAKDNLSQVEYSATYSYAYPTKTISPIPSNGVNGSNTVFESTISYDFTTGLPLSSTDANGQTSTIEYNDALLRPTKTIAPNGHQTITEYGAGTSEATRFVKVRTQIDSTNWKEGYSWYDGLGRTIKTQSIDANGDVFVETEYDNMSRPKKGTNPYRTGETKLWSESFYDDLGRVTKVKTPDLAEVNSAYSLATTGTSIGTVVTVTDQANKQRRSITNALGQLTRVDEPDTAGSLGAITAPTQPTNYAYDTLSNLTTVTQDSQTRSFVYDSLSRLKNATNPESGLMSYQYDNNGNLTQKTDGRNVVTTYIYDNLNRVTARNYSAPANLPNYQAAPNVTYTYDDTNVANSKGKLTKVTTVTSPNVFSETRYLAFDIVGRITSSQQMTDGTAYNPMSYSYNLSGALVEETYPSGRVVKNTLDNDGDLQQVQSKKANDTFRNYANSFNYTAAGAVASMRLGNGKWETTSFNSRLQPTQIGLGSSATNQGLLKLNYDYGTTDNNGNVKSQQIIVPTVGANQGFTATQTYTYDSLNRLKDAKEMIGTTQTWKQTFTFDRFGNRNFDTANTTTLGSCPVNVCNPSINPVNNRLNGYGYDTSGNTTMDAENRSFTYDAENKQTQVKGANNVVIGQYYYDGDGKRVKKFIYNTQETTIFVYDASGKMVAEYSTTVAPISEAKVSYLTTDHLGSPRITTDANGQVISRRDFHPFGEEIYTAQRTQGLGYVADTVRQKFTSYERDNESDLDFAQARMYGYGHGRFTSPDPLAASANPIRPQSWNRYSYSYNNPLRFTDPSGMIAGDFYNLDGKKIGTDGLDDKKIHIVLDKDKAKEIEKTKGNYTGTVDSKFTLPNADVVTAIGDAVNRSNNATYDQSGLPALKNDLKTSETASGGFREAGVSWKTTDGKTEITAAPDGPYSDPRDKKPATISMPSDSDGDAHIHPSGEIVTGAKSNNSIGVTTIGGTSPTTAFFIQPPSAVDIGNAGSRNRIVVGASNKTVYFYNSSGTMKQTMKLSNFLKIGK